MAFLMQKTEVDRRKSEFSDALGEGDVILDQLSELGLDQKTKVIIPDISSVDRTGKDFEYIWEHINEFEAVYELMSDEKSRIVFRNLLNFKICHDMKLIEEIFDSFELQYFDQDLIKYKEDDVFVDCGSYIGDTIEQYKKWSNGCFGKVYAIEADRNNYQILKKKFADDSRIAPVNCGVWDEKKKLMFNDLGSGSGTISDDGKVEVKADTIDNIIDTKRADFIKMDIEGAEYFALMGGRHTIEKYHPTLMISVYHKQDDYIRLPMLIKSICPDYQLFFRHYRKMSVQETVCYAIPAQS